MNFVEWECPVCKRILKLKPHETKNRKTCGNKDCMKAIGTWKKGVDKAIKTVHNKNIERKAIIKNDIIVWVKNNQEIVKNCPYNKISSTLSELHDLIYEKYGIKDWRSVFLCFEVKNLKEFLDKLKEIIISKENVC